MTYIRKYALGSFSILLALCFLLYFDSGESNSEKQKFKRIKRGMTFAQVTFILGKPDSIKYESDSTYDCLFYTKNKNGLRSEMPYVAFDKNSSVISAAYDETPNCE